MAGTVFELEYKLAPEATNRELFGGTEDGIRISPPAAPRPARSDATGPMRSFLTTRKDKVM